MSCDDLGCEDCRYHCDCCEHRKFLGCKVHEDCSGEWFNPASHVKFCPKNGKEVDASA